MTASPVDLLPPISFGAGTSAGLMVTGDRSQQREAIAVAIDHGITHFDTAPIYGWGASEVNLGATLKTLQADVLVTTKVNVTPEFLHTGQLGSCVHRSVRASLARLQRDHVDFLLIHNPVAPSRTCRADDPRQRLADMYAPVTPDDYVGAIFTAIDELRTDGLVRAAGLGGMENEPRAAARLLATGTVSIFQQTYNLINPTASLPEPVRHAGFTADTLDPSQRAIDFDDLLDIAASHGVPASVISPLAAGVLTQDAFAGVPAPSVSCRDARFPGDQGFAAAVDRARPFVQLARSAGLTVTELAYRFALSHPATRTIVGGFSTVDQVREVAPYATRGPLQSDLLDAIARCWLNSTKKLTDD